jgi:dCTP diphosphatase
LANGLRRIRRTRCRANRFDAVSVKGVHPFSLQKDCFSVLYFYSSKQVFYLNFGKNKGKVKERFMKNDKETTIQELKDLLREFRDKRDWAQFHDPKNLAEAISIEAGELQELFLWKDKEKITKELKENNDFRKEVGEELADVVIFCLNFANSTGIDVALVVEEKITKNSEKYNAEKFKGSSVKYNKL